MAKALVAKGVDCKRLLPVGFGETKPRAENKTPEGKAQNRRTTFVNAALRGKAIGGAPLEGFGKIAGDPCKYSEFTGARSVPHAAIANRVQATRTRGLHHQ